jgi:hypothetical protein
MLNEKLPRYRPVTVEQCTDVMGNIRFHFEYMEA